MDHDELLGVGIPVAASHAILGSDVPVHYFDSGGDLPPNSSFYVYNGAAAAAALEVTLPPGQSGDRVSVSSSVSRDLTVNLGKGRSHTITQRAVTTAETVNFVYYYDAWYPIRVA